MKCYLLLPVVLILTVYKTTALNPYNVLGIPAYSSLKEIRERYKQLVKQYKSSKASPKVARENSKKLAQVKDAYEIIKSKKGKDYGKNSLFRDCY